MELRFKTQIIKQREKNIQLSLWDIGMDLSQIQAKEQYKEGNYSSMKEYVGKNFGFTYDSARKYMRLYREYSERVTVTTLGLTKALLLLQVPEEYKDEFVEKVEQGMSREELSKKIIRMKSQAGSKPTYQSKEEDFILKLKRQYEEIIEHKQGVGEEVENWLKGAKGVRNPDLELLEMIKNLKGEK